MRGTARAPSGRSAAPRRGEPSRTRRTRWHIRERRPAPCATTTRGTAARGAREAVAACAAFPRIVEIGAGRGHWARALRDAGVASSVRRRLVPGRGRRRVPRYEGRRWPRCAATRTPRCCWSSRRRRPCFQCARRVRGARRALRGRAARRRERHGRLCRAFDAYRRGDGRAGSARAGSSNVLRRRRRWSLLRPHCASRRGPDSPVQHAADAVGGGRRWGHAGTRGEARLSPRSTRAPDALIVLRLRLRGICGEEL